MQKILNILTSMKLAMALVLIFAISCAVATFVENDYGTQTARALIYNAAWFELLQAALGVIVATMMIKYKIYLKPKTPIFVLHFAFILILLGSGLTRYVGYEGVLHVREGESENKMLSSESYITLKASGENGKVLLQKPVLFSAVGSQSFSASFEADGKPYNINMTSYTPNAVKTLEETPNGKPMVALVVSSQNAEPAQKIVASGESFEYGDTIFSLNKEVNSSGKKIVRLATKDGKFYMSSEQDIKTLEMATRLEAVLKSNDIYEFTKGKLYAVEGVSFVPKAIVASGKITIKQQKKSKKMQSANDMLSFELSSGTLKTDVEVSGQAGVFDEGVRVVLDGKSFDISYGSKIVNLPFSVKLNKFTLDRYPGSMSPSSYKSSVEVQKDGKKEFDYEIYMNHTLDQDGYRCFQSSYDSDEKGTILSVSKDPGKLPTYLGYILLAVGMIWSFFNPTGRFATLNKMLNESKALLLAFGMFAMLSSVNLQAEQNSSKDMATQIADSFKPIDKSVSDRFGRLMVQDSQGRIKPINTLSTEVLNKIYGKSSIMGMNSDQALLSMMLQPKSWQYVKMFKITHPDIKKALGLSENDDRASFNDIFESNGQDVNYKLARAVDEANQKRPAERGTLEKDILKIDEKVNVSYMVFTGQLLRIFPKPNDNNNTWYDPATAIMGFEPEVGTNIKTMMSMYFTKLDSAKDETSYAEANKMADFIGEYQKKIGASVYPDDSKISAELFYNKADIFKNLIFVYLLIGFALLGVEIAKIARVQRNFASSTKILWAILGLGFVAHTANLGLRWYISGHAPWSDGFESMTYIAWATILAGFIFSKKSPISFALTAILSAIILFVAHLSWMDPQITNIVPVLKSYWLTIHVSMITASYGFLALGALIGFVSLVIFIFKDESKAHLDSTLKELVIINEMTLIVGLMMLTIGNFLGGVWANESWGRYWGWDPKETWALISILVYTIVVHSRFIPVFKSIYAFSVLSVVAFGSIVMTYFGVNFYLSGLHSYASGDPVPVPTFIWVTIVIVIMAIVMAYKNRKLTV